MHLTVETVKPCVANMAGDGVRHGARGMLGGEDGAPHHYTMRAPGKDDFTLPSKAEGLTVPAGSTFVIRSAGGGGFGPASERDPALSVDDMTNDIVSSREGSPA